MAEHASAPTSTPFVDGHVHFWDTGRFELAWLAGAPHLRHAYTQDDLRRSAGARVPRSAVAVQAGASLREAEWLAAQAGDGFVSRVVLQYDPSPDGWAGVVTPMFDSVAHARTLAGVRAPVHRAAPDWTDLDGLDALAAELQQRGLVLELLLRPDQLEAVQSVARRYPALTVVLCHLGLGSRPSDAAWRAAVDDLAAHANVSMKVSGVFGSGSDASPAVRAAFESLGADRLLFGSDWPMSTAVGSYGQVLDLTAAALGPLTAAESEAIWRGTATRLYGLDETARAPQPVM